MFGRPDIVDAAVRGGFAGVRMLVVGDLMLDRYLIGDVVRISPEAPVPVVRLGRESVSVGGAGNVALNLAGLGVRADVAGWTGDDEPGARLRELLGLAGVRVHNRTTECSLDDRCCRIAFVGSLSRVGSLSSQIGRAHV